MLFGETTQHRMPGHGRPRLEGLRAFGPVVQSLVLAMLNVQPTVPVRRSVAPELVGDQNARCASVLPEQFAHQPPCRMPVAPALHQHVEHCAVPVHRPPQPVLLAVDGDYHFVEVPLVASLESSGPDAPDRPISGCRNQCGLNDLKWDCPV